MKRKLAKFLPKLDNLLLFLGEVDVGVRDLRRHHGGLQQAFTGDLSV
jgi:hypothetical protein